MQPGVRPDGAAKVLVTAATRHGATAEIARAIAEALAARGLEPAVVPPDEVRDVEGYDAVVLGSAVYGGHWLEAAAGLAARSGEALARRPVWLFSSGPVGDPSRKLVRQMAADPVELAEVAARTQARGHRMFAGRLEPRSVSRAQRVALRLFRGLEGDFRDWDEIRAWADGIADELRRRERA